MPFPEDRLESFAGVGYLTLAVDHPIREAVREGRRLREENARLKRELEEARTAAAVASRHAQEWKEAAESTLGRLERLAAITGAL